MGESSWYPSVCPHDCPSACAVEVEKLAADRIGRVRGATINSHTAGVVCRKVSAYAERVHHPDRLTRPLIRVNAKGEEGRFEPIDWEDALDLVAARFSQAAAEFGSESVWPYYYGGTMGLVQRDGIIRLANALGYSGMAKTFCVQIAYDGWQAGTGALLGTDAREIAESKLVILWGCNAAATQINLMTHVARARKNGATLVVIDPYETPTAKIADIHLAPRPGTDGALACAIMHELFRQGLADRDYLARFTDGAEGLETHLARRDPAWAEAITGIEAEKIRDLATLYGNTPSSYIRLGIGFSRSRNGAVNVHAVACLPAVTGAWQHRGGGALLSTGGVFHLDDTLIMGLDADHRGARVLDQSLIGSILCGDDESLQHGPPVKAMLIQNTNPALVAPDLGRIHAGLAREDLFVCVHEQFMTETARRADLVLPATMFMEHDDFYRSYGQTHLQIGTRVIDGPALCRSNHDVICALATRLGAQHRGFEMSPLELIDETLSASDYPPRESFDNEHVLDCDPGFETMHFVHGFGWPDGRFRFRPDWAAIGSAGKDMPSWPDHWNVIDGPTEECPLRLVAAPARGYLNSTFNTSPSSLKREKQPTLKIHPQTAHDCAVSDGQRVTVGNHRGRVTVTATLAETIQRDTVVVEGIWPESAFPEGIGINVLISAEPAAPNGGAVFHDTAVWVRPAG